MLLYTYISRFSVNPHYQQQLYLRPFFIAFFNFSHKWPTFAFAGESRYTPGFRRKIAHSGSHAETVVLLSHKKADSYIHIDVEFGEGEGKIPVDSIAKRAEAYKPKEKVTYKMIKEYIEAKYGFKVHTAYIAEVKRNLGLPMYDAPNAVEELKQPRKHPTPEKVEAIKDALRYFAVI